jgi:hypothetical protein
MTFIVRVFVDEGGAISGVVEQVRTGQNRPEGAHPRHRGHQPCHRVMVAAERAGGGAVKRTIVMPL